MRNAAPAQCESCLLPFTAACRRAARALSRRTSYVGTRRQLGRPVRSTREMPDYLIYGANGYTGSLIARAAVARGHRPVLAGRNAEALAALARELSLEYRTFPLDKPGAPEEGI